MSVQGIGPGGLPPWLRGPESARPAGERSAPDEAGGASRASEQNRTAEATVRAPALAPPAGDPGDAPIPDGVDAELWSLLTTEERTHFARFAAMGGVTYGPRTQGPAAPPVRGHRLDLRI